MKKLQEVILDEKARRVSSYLIQAKNKVSTQKEHFRSSIKEGNILNHIRLNFLEFNRNKKQQERKSLEQKGKRSLSGANLPILKEKYQTEANRQKSIDNHARNQSLAEATVQKWKKSLSGSKILLLRKSSNVNFLKSFVPVQDKRQKLSLLRPKQENVPASQLKNSQPKDYEPKTPLTLQPTPSHLYTSVRHYNLEQNLWLQHLEHQLSLTQIIEQFQKIELNRNMQTNKKLTMRQAYQLKKEIVFEIQEEKSLSVQGNIERLAEIALDDKEREKFRMIGFFIQVRNRLRVKREGNSEDSNSRDAKRNVRNSRQTLSFTQQHTFSYDPRIIPLLTTYLCHPNPHPTIITIKLYSILSLHLLKLQSPTFTEPHLQLITQTIRLKKKSQSLVQYLDEEERLKHFQGLIYLVFQFYRRLYYLRLDEELKKEMYDLLRAYLQMYEQRNGEGFARFQHKYRVKQVLEAIEPASYGLYPYLDSKVRNEVKFKSLQKELNNTSEDEDSFKPIRKPKIKLNKKTIIRHKDQMDHDDSSESSVNLKSNNSGLSSNMESSSLLNSHSEACSSVSNLSKMTSSKKRLSIQKNLTPEKIEPNQRKSKLKISAMDLSKKQHKLQIKKASNVLKLQQKQKISIRKSPQPSPQPFSTQNFSFPFIFLKSTTVYHGLFSINQTTTNTMTLQIKVTDPNSIVFVMYRFGNIKIANEYMENRQFEKFLWKVFKKIFIINYMQEQNPFLMRQPNFDLQHIKIISKESLNNELKLLEMIHSYLINWLKTRSFSFQFSGKAIPKPYFNRQDLNKYLENLQFEHQRKLFQKRHGYLDFRSGRRNSPSSNTQSNQPAQQIKFNSIRNQFYIDSKIQTDNQVQQQNKQKHIRILLKYQISDRLQYKLLKLTFLFYLYQLSIYELGFSRHYLTSLIEQKIPLLRNIENRVQLNRVRLIGRINSILSAKCSKFNSEELFTKLMENDSKLKINQHKKYRVEQCFQVDLSNEFKFIETKNVKLVQEISLADSQDVTERNVNLTKSKKSNSWKSNIVKTFNNLSFDTITQSTTFGPQTAKSTKLTCFKIQNRSFLTIAFNHPWGQRYLSVNSNIEFFKMKSELASVPKTYNYFLQTVSIYKIGIMAMADIQEIQADEKMYYFYQATKPFLSKVDNYFDSNLNKSSNLTSSIKKNGLNLSMVDNQQLRTKKLHFLTQKIYFTLTYQTIIKSKMKNSGPNYFSFQVYSSISCKMDSYPESHIPKTFIYQLSNFKTPEIKFYLISEQFIPTRDKNQLLKLIDFQQMTLMDQKMQKFFIPLHNITFRNQFYQKKTKSVRKKVISEVNYYFQENVMQMCSNVNNSDVLLGILHKYKVLQEKQQYDDIF